MSSYHLTWQVISRIRIWMNIIRDCNVIYMCLQIINPVQTTTNTNCHNCWSISCPFSLMIFLRRRTNENWLLGSSGSIYSMPVSENKSKRCRNKGLSKLLHDRSERNSKRSADNLPGVACLVPHPTSPTRVDLSCSAHSGESPQVQGLRTVPAITLTPVWATESRHFR